MNSILTVAEIWDLKGSTLETKMSLGQVCSTSYTSYTLKMHAEMHVCYC